MRIHTTHTRDAGLRQVRRINRWTIAASIALTGVLWDVAAHAFPGKTIKTSASGKSGSSKHVNGSSAKAAKPLKHPAAPPRSAEKSAPRESQPATEAAPSQESREAAPSGESAPSRESAPSQESAPAAPAPEAPSEAAPAPESPPPVVSGGS
jgi:hypothetical protein